MRRHIRPGAKLRIIGITGVLTASLLMTSLPVLGAEGTQETVESRLVAGTRTSAGKFFQLDEPIILGDPGNDGLGKEYASADAEYTLTVQARKRRGATRACRVGAVILQWSRTERDWVVILNPRLANRSTSPKRASLTTGAEDFRLDGQPTWLSLGTNGKCAGAQAWLTSSLPWHDA